MPGKCRFNNAWLFVEKYQSWLQKDSDSSHAKCKLCSKTFDISNMGESALTSHMKGKKHELAMRANAAAIPISQFIGASVQKTPTPRAPTTTQGTLDFSSKNEVLKAEILWVLKVMNSHYSYKSSEGTSRLFAAMFPDSQIATRFTCGEKKCAYIATFGLAPYIKRLLLKEVSQQTAYVVLFDESLNHNLQSKQLDIHVRVWEGGEVKSKYIGSQFLGHSTAADIVEKMCNTLSEMGIKNLIQLSMDGPYVNWKAYDMIQKEMQKQVDKSLLNIGSCGLHVLHNAFRAGSSAAGWDVEHSLLCLYWLFHDAPARHEDFINATGCSIAMLKFCKHRWLENVTVSERALKLWPHILTYLNMVRKGDLPEPKIKSFEAIKASATDPLFTLKLMIFNSIAREMAPFLTLYQTDRPMLPFFSDDMFNLMQGLLGRFCKEKPLKEANTILKLLHFPLEDNTFQKDVQKVNLGFSAEASLNKLKFAKQISERQALQIRLECKVFLITVLKKLQDKAPVNHQLVRSMQCLNPRSMASSKEMCVVKMKRILNHLVEANRVEDSMCDDVLREFGEFCNFAAQQSSFREFDPKVDRVDSLLFDSMGKERAFSRIWHVLKMLLVLSHGQASVERGFSINKEIIVENQKEQSLIAQRLIVGHIRAVGDVTNVPLTKELFMSVSCARQRYESYLDDMRRANEKQRSVEKRKALTDELDELKRKKARIHQDVSALEKAADDYANKAENTGNITFITKSNSLRRTAKEKKISLQDLNKQMDDKLLEMKTKE
ncbi:unnamed protein product [Knipowitschia caucasica]